MALYKQSYPHMWARLCVWSTQIMRMCTFVQSTDNFTDSVAENNPMDDKCLIDQKAGVAPKMFKYLIH